MAQWPSYSPTRYKHLGLTQCDRSLWRFVCLDFRGGGSTEESPACVGPHYKTKGEALVDLDRYASENYPEPTEAYVAQLVDRPDRAAPYVFNHAGENLAKLWSEGKRVEVLENLIVLGTLAAPVLYVAARELAPDQAIILVGMFAGHVQEVATVSATSRNRLHNLAA